MKWSGKCFIWPSKPDKAESQLLSFVEAGFILYALMQKKLIVITKS